MSKFPWANVSPEILIDLFSDLAKVLSVKSDRDIPVWMTLPGKQWPMYQSLIEMAKTDINSGYVGLIELMSKLPSGTIKQKWKSFDKLISGKNGAQLCLHESMYRQGRILGPITFQAKALYEEVGLKPEGAELADHISVELEFMAYLCQQISKNDLEIELWEKARALFYNKHLKNWMPSLGQELIKSNDHAWKIVGNSLIVLFGVDRLLKSTDDKERKYPSILIENKCSLCGFCVQVCPSNALQMVEDEKKTALWLNEDQCIHCNKCARVCPEETMVLTEPLPRKTKIILRESPRAICSSCQRPTISQAELDFTSNKLGHPDWLNLCHECRSISLEILL